MMTPLRVRNMNDKLKAIIYHIVKTLGRVDGRTRLMKLIYLIDMEAAKELGHPVSGARFYSYSHGPFAREVLSALAELNVFWIKEHVTTNIYGDRRYVYTPSNFPFVEPLEIDDPREKEIVERVVNRWGGEDLSTLLRHVYNTKPFKGTPACADIDFSVVSKPS